MISVQYVEKLTDWKEAISQAAKPLIEKGYISPRYVQGIFESVAQNGPYFVLMDGIALPHCSWVEEVQKTSCSLLKLGQPVLFPGGAEVSVFLCLAAISGDAHMKLLSEMSELLLDDDRVDRLLSAHSLAQVEACIC